MKNNSHRHETPEEAVRRIDVVRHPLFVAANVLTAIATTLIAAGVCLILFDAAAGLGSGVLIAGGVAVVAPFSTVYLAQEMRETAAQACTPGKETKA